LTEVFCDLPQAIQANARLLSQIMWWLLPSIAFLSQFVTC